MRNLSVFVLLLVALSTLGASVSLAKGTRVLATIKGRAIVSPIAPVSRPGQPDSKPLAAAVLSLRRGVQGKEIARVVADSEGRFELKHLQPGKYTLVPLAPNPEAILPRGEPQELSLKPGACLTVEVRYDSGIR